MAINNIPLAVEVPNNLLKYLSFKIFLFTKTKSSSTPYKLLSIEENKFSNIVFIVFIMFVVISVLFSNISLPFYIKDCIADNTKSIPKINT